MKKTTREMQRDHKTKEIKCPSCGHSHEGCGCAGWLVVEAHARELVALRADLLGRADVLETQCAMTKNKIMEPRYLGRSEGMKEAAEMVRRWPT